MPACQFIDFFVLMLSPEIFPAYVVAVIIEQMSSFPLVAMHLQKIFPL